MKELWIRSQDKEKLLIAKDVRIEKHFRNRTVETDLGQEVDMRNGEDIFYLLANKGTKIGEYKTEERALEVLDEIQKLLMPTIEYNPVVKREESWEEEYQRTVLKGYNVKVEQSITYVYEMPKE